MVNQMQIHVDSIESLEVLAAQLKASSSRIDEYCQQAVYHAQQRLESAHENYISSVSRCESAKSEVNDVEANVSECKDSLSSDSITKAPDTQQEAYSSMSEAWNALEEAKNELEEAEDELEQASGELKHAMIALEAISASAYATRDHLQHQLSGGIDFLETKINQLRDYILSSPDFASSSPKTAGTYARAWMNWTPPPNVVLQHSALTKRLQLPHPLLTHLSSIWVKQDNSLARQINTLRERYRNAKSQQEIDAVRITAQRGASGRLGELIAENALRPFAHKIESQRRTLTRDNEHVTITDFVLRDLKVPIHMGRLQLPMGVDVAVETKCGRASYLKHQLTHMERQVDGHHREHASFCFLSKDFRQLDRASKQLISQTLGKKRSKIYAILPEKSVMDSLIWKQITTA